MDCDHNFEYLEPWDDYICNKCGAEPYKINVTNSYERMVRGEI